jgi:integrase
MIRKRPSKVNGVRYQATIRANGETVNKTFAKRCEARKWEEYMRVRCAELSQSDFDNPYADTTLVNFCNEWFEKSASLTKAASSLIRDQGIIRQHVQPFFGNKLLGEVSVRDADAWMRWLVKSQSLSFNSANRCRAMMTKVYADALRWGAVTSNPVASARPFRLDKKLPRYWSEPEVRQFLSFVQEERPELYLGFCLALCTGARKGELRGIRWSDIDFTRARISICRTYCFASKAMKQTTKGKAERIVPMNELLKAALLDERRSQGEVRLDSEVLLSFPWGVPTKLLTSLCRRAGVKTLCLHGMRHTFASNLVMAGVPIYTVSKILGHSDVKTTEIYAHLRPEHFDGVTNALNFGTNQKLSDGVVPLRRGFSG